MPQYNYGDVALDGVMEILTKMGVLEGGKIVGVLGQRREASLAEMSLQANQLFRFEMAGDLNLND